MHVLERVVETEKSDEMQHAPDGYFFIIAPWESVRSYSYIAPEPSWGAGANWTEYPGRSYASYTTENPFQADLLAATYTGILAVNTKTETCIRMPIDATHHTPQASVGVVPVESVA